jgi:DNA processing protein
MNSRIQHAIALSLINGVGSINAKKLIAYTGSIDGVFKEKKANLLKVPGVGEQLAAEIKSAKVMQKAEEEMAFLEKYKVRALFYLDDDYPARLKHCNDSPIILFVKGDVNFENTKVLSIVGTRSATDYGKTFTENLIRSLAEQKHNVLIVSGLAFGIDIAAHKAALKYKLETVAALGHGLNTIYPAIHRKYAKDIVNQGALVTEYVSDQTADRAFFVKRNRIIAGLADATIVVESGERGGALITAEIANVYNRDVFAVPGRIDDEHSKGCNKLIKANKAALLESFEDIEYLLGWERPDSSEKPKTIQRELFVNLTDDDRKIIEIIRNAGQINLDILSVMAEMPVSKVSPMLLNLEFAGLVKCLPGKMFRMV